MVSMVSKKGLSVIIIDDNEMTRAVLRMALQGDTYDVVGDAASGKLGLEMVGKLKPDLICLDINMPDSNGLDLLEQIKKALPQTLVLMVTAANDRETVKTALQRGANGFILKPFNPGTVLDTIDKVTAALRAKKAALL